jgi:hypothetical protein
MTFDIFFPADLYELARAFNDLLAELHHSLASGGQGIDREPQSVLADLDEVGSALWECATEAENTALMRRRPGSPS